MLADEESPELTPVWRPRDRMLVQALSMFEASLCSGCQQVRSRSMNPDMEGEYEVQAHPCMACGPLEKARKETREPGLKLFVVDGGPPDAELMPWVLDLRPEDEKADDD